MNLGRDSCPRRSNRVAAICFLCATFVSSVPLWLVFVGCRSTTEAQRHRGHGDFTKFEWRQPKIALHSDAKPLDCLLEDLHASLKFANRNKLAGAMRDANVARTKDHSLRAKFSHLCRFSAESYSAGLVSG